MDEIVLFVDDEPNILSTLNRQFLDADFSVRTADSAAAAIGLLTTMPVAVLVSDNVMPGMSGVDLLCKAKELSPETVRILLTAYADVHSAMQAINAGEVFKFLTKPWDPLELKSVVASALDRHRVVRTLRQSDEATLRSLAQTIELKDPYTRSHCDRVADYALRIAARLGLPADLRLHIKHGSWLHDCGKIGVPEEILNFNGPLDNEKMEVIKNHPQWGADVARTARLPEATINVILYHHERFDGTGYPSRLKGEAIPIEARIVTVADTYDALTSDRPYRKKIDLDRAWEIMTSLSGSLFDPVIFSIFHSIMRNAEEIS